MTALFILLISLYVVIIGLEVPSLLQGRMYRDLAFFTIFFALGVYLSLALFFSWNVPNPLEAWIKMQASQ